jgi:hypothetical protein
LDKNLRDQVEIFMMKKNLKFNLIINSGILLFGSAMVFSGLLLQISYHMGHQGRIDTNHLVLGLHYFNWSDIHKISITAVSIGMVFHIILHWKWYTAVLKKTRLIFKNQQALLLTTVFLLTALTGYIPWFIQLSGGSEFSRKEFIEIHDKLTWILSAYLIFHVTKRFKWYFTAFKKATKCLENQTDIRQICSDFGSLEKIDQ